MATTCTRCSGSGFLNVDQIPESVLCTDHIEKIKNWVQSNEGHDVQVCDCCGDGEEWHKIPGEHYNGEEHGGAYDYNGGLCECH